MRAAHECRAHNLSDFATMLDLALLQHFVMVAQHKSFTRAADQLHVSQSAVSRSIARLEQQIGARLIERTTRAARLTLAGENFLKEALSILERLNVASRNAQRTAEGAAGAIAIAVCPGTSAETPRLSSAVQAFRDAWPDVRVQLSPVLSNEQPALLRNATYDVGVMRLAVSDSHDLQWHSLARDPLMVAAPAVWRLGRSRMRLAELRDRPWMMPNPKVAPALYDQQVQLCRSAGFDPKIVAFAEDAITSQIMIACGVGCAFVNARRLARQDQGIELIELQGLSDLYIAETCVASASATTSKLVRAFVDALIASPSPPQKKGLR